MYCSGDQIWFTVTSLHCEGLVQDWPITPSNSCLKHEMWLTWFKYASCRETYLLYQVSSQPRLQSIITNPDDHTSHTYYRRVNGKNWTRKSLTVCVHQIVPQQHLQIHVRPPADYNLPQTQINMLVLLPLLMLPPPVYTEAASEWITETLPKPAPRLLVIDVLPLFTSPFGVSIVPEWLRRRMHQHTISIKYENLYTRSTISTRDEYQQHIIEEDKSSAIALRLFCLVWHVLHPNFLSTRVSTDLLIRHSRTKPREQA